MKSIIYKFKMTARETEITVPVNSTLISVQTQKNEVVLHILIPDLEAEPEQRTFIAIRTGDRFDGLEKLQYVGTCFLNDGENVEHIFEVKK